MNETLTTLQEYLEKLGIEPYIASVYLSLHTNGPQSISQLARDTNIERTRIYRLLDKIHESNLIEVENKYKSKLLRAAPLSNLQVLFSKKEQELDQLQQELPKIENILSKNRSVTEKTRIEFYHGSDGTKQMLWNETRAKGQIVSILRENIQTKTAEKFFERWVKLCNERQLKFRSVVSDEFIQSQKNWYSDHSNEKLKYWKGRYISRKSFPINHSIVIYDDVACFFSWTENEIYGIEIHNQDIADTQRQFFEVIWAKSSALPTE